MVEECRGRASAVFSPDSRANVRGRVVSNYDRPALLAGRHRTSILRHSRGGARTRGSGLGYFPMQKRLKMAPSKSSAVNSPVIGSERGLRFAQLLGEELERVAACVSSSRRREHQVFGGSVQRAQMPLACEKRPFHVSVRADGGKGIALAQEADPGAAQSREPDLGWHRSLTRRARFECPPGRSCCARRSAAATGGSRCRRSRQSAARMRGIAGVGDDQRQVRHARLPPRCVRCRAFLDRVRRSVASLPCR